ncbi:hypothetical protein Q9F31_001449 [Vibrio alginolyticus]|nr:hypothetical protein [Vibrio alginolyticus]
MEVSVVISVLALIASCLSALYSRWSVKQASRANDIGRLNALLALKEHYLRLLEKQHGVKINPRQDELHSKAFLYNVKKGSELEIKLREVNEQINSYHKKVIENKI